jgi:urease accessory protein UreF
MLAEASSQLGNAFLEKSDAIEGESDTELLAAKEKHDAQGHGHMTPGCATLAARLAVQHRCHYYVFGS